LNREFRHGKTFLIYFFAYLPVSVNFAIIFFKLPARKILAEFQRERGTTNVYRQRLFWATVILLLDIGRALVVAAVAVHFLEGQYLPGCVFFLSWETDSPAFMVFAWQGVLTI